MLLERFNSAVDKIIHDPVAGAAADFIKKVVKHCAAKLRMSNLGVELNGINFFIGVLHSRTGAVVGFADDFVSLRRFRDVVGVAHPNSALLFNIFKQQAVCVGIQLNFAVFAYGSG